MLRKSGVKKDTEYRPESLQPGKSSYKFPGEMRPVRCKTEAENMKIQSPNVPKQEERLLVLEMSFRNLAVLLMNASTEWKSSELQQLQEFLRHQTQCYTACILTASSADAEVRNWNEFWSKLDRYLSEKSFSSCAWESARTVIIRVMRQFIKFTKKSSNAIC
ncbi:interferon kappa-like [Clarias gariepinus]